MTLTILLIGSFLLGTVPTGLVVVRLVKGIDIRSLGSGNIGATNVVRAAGWGWGITTLLIDVLKGAAIPLVLGFLSAPPEPLLRWQIAAGLLALVGNLFNPFLRFKGGKGVGTAIGITAVVAPWPLLVALGTFAVAVALTRIVSVGSLAAGLALAVTATIAHLSPSTAPPIDRLIFCWLLFLIVLYTHRTNIGRLLSGTERRLTDKK